ncbi:unnamed protein product [Schistocephalus solidus]|uniref:Endo/exonuclease/phosphatase domain-containing protein n=1 Tax=Schistocephalus solidus TaxID=70667 RepID=A0A183STA0_SCHSO|nr:unnamed protein product [Schistocephalus solidus]
MTVAKGRRLAALREALKSSTYDIILLQETHARYHINHKRDVVEGHRLGQAMELMEFVRATAGSADVIFIGGDLNLEPYTTGLNLLKRSLGLKDAWLDQLERQPVTDLNALELEGCTCENKSNPFASKAWTATSGNGLRLDYLLYRPGVQGPSNVSVLCESCRLEMREIPNGDGLHYSDHEGVAGYFRLSRHPETFVDHIPPVGLIQTLDDLLRDALTILNRQISRAKRFRALHFTLAAVLLLLVLFFGTYWPFTHPALAFLQTLVVLLSGAIIFSLMWGNLVGRQCELNALRNMVNLVEHYSELSLVTKTP